MLRVHWQFVNWDTLIYMSCILIDINHIWPQSDSMSSFFSNLFWWKAMNVQDVCDPCLPQTSFLTAKSSGDPRSNHETSIPSFKKVGWGSLFFEWERFELSLTKTRWLNIFQLLQSVQLLQRDLLFPQKVTSALKRSLMGPNEVTLKNLVCDVSSVRDQCI